MHGHNNERRLPAVAELGSNGAAARALGLAQPALTRSIHELADASWATTSITRLADNELGALFSKHGLPPPRLVAQTQSALSLVMTLVYSDMLAMLPVQFLQFALAKDAITSIPVQEHVPAPTMALVRRAGLSLTPAAEYFVELLRKRPAGGHYAA